MGMLLEYILSISTAAILCAIVRRLLDKKGTPGAVGKLLTGIFMAVTVLSPLTGFSFGGVEDLLSFSQIQAEKAVEAGEKQGTNALRKSISDQVQAYILEKAQALGADIQVEIILSADTYPVPECVRISGQIAPYAKTMLKQILREDLGILEENQIWT